MHLFSPSLNFVKWWWGTFSCWPVSLPYVSVDVTLRS